MSIEVRGVNKRFGPFQALTDVTLSVPSGQLTALLGPSGGGKSTLLRVVAGLEEPDSGTVLVDGRDMTGVPARRRGVGFVFQHYAAFGHLTVWDNVAFGLKVAHAPKAEVRERVDELLRLVHLEGFARRYPSQLSGGQRQRMALARALAVRPRLLLLDEPFGALDVKVREELRGWLRRLHEQMPVTTVFVTHDQEEAMELADQIVVVNGGRVEQAGTPQDLYDSPANDFVMGFLGPVTRLGARLVRPHDVEVLGGPAPGAVQAVVERLVHLGFESRIELLLEGGGQASVQLTRAQAGLLELEPGDLVHLRHAGASPVYLPARSETASRTAGSSASAQSS